jgi:hypothetical protein
MSSGRRIEDERQPRLRRLSGRARSLVRRSTRLGIARSPASARPPRLTALGFLGERTRTDAVVVARSGVLSTMPHDAAGRRRAIEREGSASPAKRFLHTADCPWLRLDNCSNFQRSSTNDGDSSKASPLRRILHVGPRPLLSARARRRGHRKAGALPASCEVARSLQDAQRQAVRRGLLQRPCPRRGESEVASLTRPSTCNSFAIDGMRSRAKTSDGPVGLKKQAVVWQRRPQLPKRRF